MNIIDKLPDLSINPRRLTKKKQQTGKKIEYVREYVRRWAYVMLERETIHTINFIDCMCNAGVYRDGDCCTVVEVLQIFLEMEGKYPNKKFQIWCNDNSLEKIKILKKVIGLFPQKRQVRVFISGKDVNEYLDQLTGASNLSKSIFEFGAATILYIDPFDFGTVEIPKVTAVLKEHYCELLFNFFVSDYTRNIKKDNGRISKCLGGAQISTKEDLIAYMRAHLRVGHIKYLFAYQFRTQKNVELYQIVFATPNAKGLEKLKEALWKVFNGSEFHRNQIESGQMCLFTPEYNEDNAIHLYASEARDMLCEKFAGKEAQWEQIEQFLVEYTMLKESQILKSVLIPLINNGEVQKCNLCRKNNYKEDRYRFLRSQ